MTIKDQIASARALADAATPIDFRDHPKFMTELRQELRALSADLERACELLEDFQGVAADVGHPLAADACRAFLAGEVPKL